MVAGRFGTCRATSANRIRERRHLPIRLVTGLTVANGYACVNKPVRLNRSPGKRPRCRRRSAPIQSSVPVIDADAPNIVRALDFQFFLTMDDKTVKIASAGDGVHLGIPAGLLRGFLRSARNTVGQQIYRVVRQRLCDECPNRNYRPAFGAVSQPVDYDRESVPETRGPTIRRPAGVSSKTRGDIS